MDGSVRPSPSVFKKWLCRFLRLGRFWPFRGHTAGLTEAHTVKNRKCSNRSKTTPDNPKWWEKTQKRIKTCFIPFWVSFGWVLGHLKKFAKNMSLKFWGWLSVSRSGFTKGKFFRPAEAEKFFGWKNFLKELIETCIFHQNFADRSVKNTQTFGQNFLLYKDHDFMKKIYGTKMSEIVYVRKKNFPIFLAPQFPQKFKRTQFWFTTFFNCEH